MIVSNWNPQSNMLNITFLWYNCSVLKSLEI